MNTASTCPNDARLPNGGTQQCGFYDIKPTLLGQGVNRVINSKELPNGAKPQRYWDGITLTFNGRLPKNITLGGGLDAGQQVRDNCFTVDAPNIPRDITGLWNGGVAGQPGGSPFCRQVTSFMDNMDIRVRGSVPLKWDINLSAVFRNTAGAAQNATWAVSNADIAAGRVAFKNGRTSFAGNLAQTIGLHPALEYYGDRFNQLDVAVNKSFNTGVGRLRVALDIYNFLNANSIQSVTTTYTNNPATNRWLRPSGFMDPRLMRVTASLNF